MEFVLLTDLKPKSLPGSAVSKQEDCQNGFWVNLCNAVHGFAHHLSSRVDRSTPSIMEVTSPADKSITFFSEALLLMALSAFQGIMELYVTGFDNFAAKRGIDQTAGSLQQSRNILERS